MKKAKITLYDKRHYHYINTRNGLKEVYPSCVLLLSREEYSDLKYYLNQHRVVVGALFDFAHNGCCTKAHKYKIWHTFNESYNVEYEWNKEF